MWWFHRRRLKAAFDHDIRNLSKYLDRHVLTINKDSVICASCKGNCGSCNLDRTLENANTMYDELKASHHEYFRTHFGDNIEGKTNGDTD